MTNEEKNSIIDKLNKARPVGQAVKTLASHAENMGSIPVRVTKKRERHPKVGVFLFFCAPHKTEPTCAITCVQICRNCVAQGVRIPRREALEVLR